MAATVKSKNNSVPDLSNDDPKASIITPPPSKKLKQARLPFKVLPPKPVQPIQSPTNKKRKASDGNGNSGLQKPPKTPKSEDTAARKCPGRDVENAENEVSSSSEAESILKTKNVEPCTKKPVIGLMDKFVHSTQQREVSTSGTSIDLIDSDSEDNEAKGRAIESQTSESTEEKVSKLEGKDECIPETSADLSETVNENNGEDKKKASEGESTNKVDGDKTDSMNNSAIESDPNSSIDVTKETEDFDSELDSSVLSETKGSSVSLSPSQSEVKSEAADKVMSTPTSASAVPRVKAKTPKLLEKEKEKQLKLAEKEKEKIEKQKQREAAKAEKEKQRKEEKERKEQEKLEEKRQKEEEKQRQQEEKDREKEEKRKLKEKEKEEKLKQKEEEKLKKQESMTEEKKKKEEEKQKKDELEEERKKKKEKESLLFKSFFAKSKSNSPPKASPVETKSPFIVFEVKKDMRLAPLRRHFITSDSVANLDQKMVLQDVGIENLYIEGLKHRKHSLGKSSATWPKLDEDCDVQIVDGTKTVDTMRVKRLQFCENYRPAYYGTWRKKSKIINPRNPLKQDKALLDYDVESDDEWEEEEPGESLSNSEGEDGDSDGGGDNEDEEEDGFFVPHGYLSNDEGGESDDEDLDPERQKARQLAEAKSWDAEMKRPKRCETLRPICLGCCWETEDVVRDPSWDLLEELRMVPTFNTLLPIITLPEDLPAQSPKDGGSSDAKSRSKDKSKYQPVPEEAIMDLIKLVHGNIWSIQKLVKEFREFWRRKQLGLPVTPSDTTADKLEEVARISPVNVKDSVGNEPMQSETVEKEEKEESNKEEIKEESSKEESKEESNKGECKEESSKEESKDSFVYSISKRQLEVKIRELAVYEKQDGFKTRCWYVHTALLDKYGHKDLPVPTRWQWLTRSNTSAYGRCQSVEKETVLSLTKSAGKKTPTSANSGRSILDFTVRGASPNLVPAPPPKLCSKNEEAVNAASPTSVSSPKPQLVSASSETPKGKRNSITASALFKHGKKSPFTSPLAQSGKKKHSTPPPALTLKDCFQKSSGAASPSLNAASQAQKPTISSSPVSTGTDDSSGDCIIISAENITSKSVPPSHI